ncbi:DUF2141 domain-containing protein [Flavobacteriaceae bacterium AU392]|nr:DUF2141 domain-containing protein [Flavobacteriaceae bacterium]RKM83637.1 DUF2141 domain-containing protein [Flavobacteriaceae bacterium AU392]
MKTFFLFITITFTTLITNAQENIGQDITVIVNNVLNSKGKVLFSLHSETTFMKGAGIQNSQSEIKDGKATITFKNVKPGEYAILVLHDENENNRMDFEPNGMPIEHYGVSNNNLAFGPPIYSEAKFKVENDNLNLSIKLLHAN